MLCRRCAALIEDGSKICIHCGADQEEEKKNKRSITDKIDSEEKSITFVDCLITFFVGGIPVVGLIMLLIWSFGAEKIKGRSVVAKAFLLWSVLVSLIIFVGFIYLCLYALKTADIQ